MNRLTRPSDEYGRQWWSRRWLEALERAGWEDRLERGRAYARAGRVLDLRVDKGLLTARVQGSARQPYAVEVRVLPLPAATWNAATAALARRAANLAELFSGRLSEAVDGAFEAAGARLFPEELQAECTCPDWAVPCKHVAAVCYVFGAQLDADPFLIFQLRGRGRDAFVAALEQAGSPGGDAPASPGARERRPAAVVPSAYWSPGPLPRLSAGDPPLGLPDSLTEPDWWRGPVLLRELLRHVYVRVEAACDKRQAGEAGTPQAPADPAEQA